MYLEDGQFGLVSIVLKIRCHWCGLFNLLNLKKDLHFQGSVTKKLLTETYY